MKRFRDRLTWTFCLVTLLSLTGNMAQADHEPTLIIKAKGHHGKRFWKRVSPALPADGVTDKKSDDADKANFKLKRQNLQIEVLTGGNWVILDTSAKQIQTSNRPLRISYRHLQEPPQKEALKLELNPHQDQLTYHSPQKTPLETTGKSESPCPYLSNDHTSAIYPRLQPGIYSLKVSPAAQKSGISHIEVRLVVSDALPEPPLISSIDQRLARQGELSLKLQNIVVHDEISLFVNGNPLESVTIKQESQLDSYLALGSVLPPGPSTIMVRVKRGDRESEYSSAVKAVSRATVIMARNTKLNQEDFEDRSRNSKVDPRLKDETGFEFVNNQDSSSNKTNKNVTVDELTRELQKLEKSLKQVIHQAVQNQVHSTYQKQINQLTSDIKALSVEVKKSNKLLKDQSKDILDLSMKVTNLSDEVQSLKTCIRYLHSGWSEEPIFTWPSPAAVEESHLKPQKELTTVPLSTGRALIDKKHSNIIARACNQSGEFTLDITFKALDPGKAKQELMRIVTFSKDHSLRNFTLGQYKDELVFRIRTDGAPPAMPNTLPDDQNGLGKTSGGAQGIHFYNKLKAGETYNVVVSFYDQTLHFWVNGKQLPLEVDYAKPISNWDHSYQLLLGDEFVVSDDKRKWSGEVHSFSIRKRGVDLAKPIAGVFKCLFSKVSNQNYQNVAHNGASERALNNLTSSPAADSESMNLEPEEDKTIAVREFAFPYPASFPLPRYQQDGGAFEIEGAVLDQMRLAIAKDGRYQLDFETRTTVRAVITLQLLVQLEDGQWYPITIPKQTIEPGDSNQDLSRPANYAGTMTVKGYAPVLVNQSERIRDIRRRGNALFGTPPYIN